MTRIFSALYHLAWLAALPFLQRSPRIALGWSQRTLQEAPEGPFDLWIQSASGGESLLTGMILADLAARLPAGKTLRVLATSGTQQGVDSLEKGCRERGNDSPVRTEVRFFPFDSPRLMAKAFERFSPRLCVIVETELWPGFLWQARRHRVPVLLVNGRMSRKSFRSYRHFRRFFQQFGPERIWAISPEDGNRFAHNMGEENVEVMNNIKFDRIVPQQCPAPSQVITDLIPADTPFVLLGSIRKEEEDKICTTITQLLATRPDVVIGLFPKHIERAEHWLSMLAARGIPARKRSLATGPCPAGSVLVWDLFGELAGAYGLAKTTFIGGSLVDLGGQNFLEPLVFGLKPLIGPYWSNFAWVSRQIVDDGLVREVPDEQHLATELIAQLDTTESREQIIEQVQHFLTPRKGGTKVASHEIYKRLTAYST